MANILKKFLFAFSITILFSACSSNANENKSFFQKNKITEINQKLAKIEIESLIGSKITEAARSQIGVVTEYDTSYYNEAYPPENKGACADVIWRAFMDLGWDFKKIIDEDMKKYSDKYPDNPIPDQNINFRRVRNIKIFLEKNAQSLDTKVLPNDFENLKNWQAGDIVTFAQIPGGLWHIAVISDLRRDDGVPLIIHNYGRGVKENDYLLDWPTEITGHYRIDENIFN